MKLPAFEYHSPTSLADALQLLSLPDVRPLAGGQSLLPVMAFRLSTPAALVDLHRVPGLNNIEITDDTVRLGAMVRWCDLERHSGLRAALPILPAAMEHVAHFQIRTRGTIGGSLAHADPAAEFPGLAVAFDAMVRVRSSGGERMIAAADFFVGALDTSLKAGEMIVEVTFARWPSTRRWAFEEFSRRRGDFAIAGVALHYDLDGGTARNVRIGAIGASDRPIRLKNAEQSLEGSSLDIACVAAAKAAASNEVDPPKDLNGTPDYRRSLVGTLLERALHKAAR